MFEPANKSKRNNEEDWFVYFYRQPWTSNGFLEVN